MFYNTKVFQRAVLEQEIALLFNDWQTHLAGIIQWSNMPVPLLHCSILSLLHKGAFTLDVSILIR